jgi:hypothetical protein
MVNLKRLQVSEAPDCPDALFADALPMKAAEWPLGYPQRTFYTGSIKTRSTAGYEEEIHRPLAAGHGSSHRGGFSFISISFVISLRSLGTWHAQRQIRDSTFPLGGKREGPRGG